MPIVAVYAALLTLLFVGLSIRTIRLRGKLNVALGDGGQPLLTRAARAQANFAEYVPLALLLIYFLEALTTADLWIHLLCSILLLGRLVHAYGLSQVQENYRLRVFGMTCTFIVLISAALGLLIVAVVSAYHS